MTIAEQCLGVVPVDDDKMYVVLIEQYERETQDTLYTFLRFDDDDGTRACVPVTQTEARRIGLMLLNAAEDPDVWG